MDISKIYRVFIEDYENYVSLLDSYGANILMATAVLLLGWAVSLLCKYLVIRTIQSSFAQKIMEYFKVKKTLASFEVTAPIETIIAPSIAGVVFMLFFRISAQLLNMSVVTRFLDEVFLYLPHVLIAILILFFTLQMSGSVGRFVETAVNMTHHESGKILGMLTRVNIFVFGFLSASYQIGLPGEYIKIVFIGIIFMGALAGGLAFGMGSVGVVQRFIDDIIKK